MPVKDGTHPEFLLGGGEMGALIRSRDWTETPLGAPETWPQSLRSALSICLHSSFPTAIYWGADLRLLYNDAWAPIPADRHPWALGRPGAEVWADIWEVVGPQFAEVVRTGVGFSTYDQMLPMIRGGVQCETYWNYSFTAIRGEDGSVVGVFNQGNETTGAVLARNQAEAELERLGNLFEQAPSAVAILRGPTHVFEVVNPAYEALAGMPGIVGKTVVEIFPEVVPQGFVALLDQVYETGEPYVGRAVPVVLERGPDGARKHLIDFIYQPIKNELGEPNGIFVQATDVTDPARAVAALQESEAKFQAIVNSIDQMIWSTRPDGFHDYFNDRWYEYTDVPAGSTDGDSWNGMFHPDDRARAREIWNRSLATGEPYHIEYRLRHRSGQYRWVIGRAQCVRDDAGDIIRWFGTCTDVHDLKMAEEELAEQARVLEILNRTGKAIASDLDLERIVQTVTDDGVDLTGAAFGAFFRNVKDDNGESYMLYTISGVSDDHFAKFPMPRNTGVFEHTFRGSGIVRSDDITQDPRYGNNPPYNGIPEGHLPVRSYLAIPVTSRSGEVIGGLFFGHPDAGVFTERSERLVSGIASQAVIAIDNAQLFRAAQHEIAERKRQETALRESEEFSRSLVESSGDCIKVLGLDGSLRFMNESGMDLLELDGFSAVDGKPWKDIFPDEARAEVEAALQSARAGGIGRFSAFCPTVKGTPKWWDVIVTPVPGADGKPAHLVSIARDVTEQRKAEDARQLLLRELNHRVKNLFSVTSGMISMTARGAPTVKAFADSLRGRITALAKAHELIQSAITAESHQESASLRQLLEDLIRPHIDGTDASQLQIDGAEVTVGPTAATSLALILHELATNAAKYGALAVQGGRLAIKWTLDDGHLNLEWQETVPGATIESPQTQGFGSKLASASASGQLGGSISYDWQPDGVRIDLKVSVGHLDR